MEPSPISFQSEPLRFKGCDFRAPKKFLKGTHRSCDPEETYEKIRASSFDFGLTRNADITGLDRIGIPVTAAVRPNGLTLSVSSGKGLTQAAAMVSGYMEAYELYHCETHPFAPREASFEQMSQEMLTPDPFELAMKKNAAFHKKWPMRWVMGWDLITQQEIAFPLMLVSLDYRLHRSSSFFELNPFERTSNGLASGNHFLEALSSALYEVIERDAISCYKHAENHYLPPKVVLESIPFEAARGVLYKLQEAGISLELYDCTLDTEAYVFKALIYDEKHRHQGVGEGYGAHLDPEVAMLRAITEAVQGRAIYISGSRDDIFLSHFQLFKKIDSEKAIQNLKAQDSTIDARCYCNKAGVTFEDDIQILLRGLRKIGVSHVGVFELQLEKSPFPVVRVIIPGLEAYATQSCLMGRRAIKFAASKKGNEHSELPQLATWHAPAGGIS